MTDSEKWTPASGAVEHGKHVFRNNTPRDTPPDMFQVEAYIDIKRGMLVILGDPPGEDQDPECEIHNCDQMGCNWEHVVIRKALAPGDCT